MAPIPILLYSIHIDDPMSDKSYIDHNPSIPSRVFIWCHIQPSQQQKGATDTILALPHPVKNQTVEHYFMRLSIVNKIQIYGGNFQRCFLQRRSSIIS